MYTDLGRPGDTFAVAGNRSSFAIIHHNILLNVHVFIILCLYVKFWNHYVKLVISSVHYSVIVHMDHTGNKICDLSCVIHGMDKCTLNSIICHMVILYLIIVYLFISTMYMYC